jgi:hypothetical protein
MLYGEEVAVCSEINLKPVVYGQNVNSRVLNILVHANSRL